MHELASVLGEIIRPESIYHGLYVHKGRQGQSFEINAITAYEKSQGKAYKAEIVVQMSNAENEPGTETLNVAMITACFDDFGDLLPPQKNDRITCWYYPEGPLKKPFRVLAVQYEAITGQPMAPIHAFTEVEIADLESSVTARFTGKDLDWTKCESLMRQYNLSYLDLIKSVNPAAVLAAYTTFIKNPKNEFLPYSGFSGYNGRDHRKIF